MSTENTNAPSSSSFTKAFLVGLIVGVVVGGFAGAFLPPLLEGYRLPTPRESGTRGGTPPKVTTREENREAPKPEGEQPKPAEEPKPEEPKPQEPKPAEKPNG